MTKKVKEAIERILQARSGKDLFFIYHQWAHRCTEHYELVAMLNHDREIVSDHYIDLAAKRRKDNQ
jgi:hypothetical protein